MSVCVRIPFALVCGDDGSHYYGHGALSLSLSAPFVTFDLCRGSLPTIPKVSYYLQLYKSDISIVKQDYFYNQQKCQIKSVSHI